MVMDLLKKGKGTIVDHVAPRFALLEAGPERLQEVIKEFFAYRDVKLGESGWDIYCPATGEDIPMLRYDVYVPGGDEVLSALRTKVEEYEKTVQGKREKIAELDTEPEKSEQDSGFLGNLLSRGDSWMNSLEQKHERDDLQKSLSDAMTQKLGKENQLETFEAGQPYRRSKKYVGDVMVWPYLRALVISTGNYLNNPAEDFSSRGEEDISSVTISSRLLDDSAYQLAQELADYIHEQLLDLTVVLRDHRDIKYEWLPSGSSSHWTQFRLYEERIEEG